MESICDKGLSKERKLGKRGKKVESPNASVFPAGFDLLLMVQGLLTRECMVTLPSRPIYWDSDKTLAAMTQDESSLALSQIHFWLEMTMVMVMVMVRFPFPLRSN